MSAATQIYYTRFDDAFFILPRSIQEGIESKIDELGVRLATFPHHRLTESNRYRLRASDYRIIYTFEPSRNTLHLLAFGHRREIYRNVV